jgi:hypothetical protein
MRLIKASNGKTKLNISKKEWLQIGRTAGWGLGSTPEDWAKDKMEMERQQNSLINDISLREQKNKGNNDIEKPLSIGDKVKLRNGNKGVIEDIIENDLEDGTRTFYIQSLKPDGSPYKGQSGWYTAEDFKKESA